MSYQIENPLREIFEELKPLFDSQGRTLNWEYSRRDKLLMRASLYSCPVGIAFAFGGAYWHVGWADYVAQVSILVCWISGAVLMTSGVAGGVKAIKRSPIAALDELAESSDVEWPIIARLQEKDDFLLGCAEAKLKGKSQEAEGRSNLLPSFLDRYKVLLPGLVIALTGAGILQQLLHWAFGVDLAQVVVMLFVGFFIGQFFARRHAEALSRAIFVVQQAREAKKSSYSFPASASDMKLPSRDATVAPEFQRASRPVEPVSTSLN